MSEREPKAKKIAKAISNKRSWEMTITCTGCGNEAKMAIDVKEGNRMIQLPENRCTVCPDLPVMKTEVKSKEVSLLVRAAGPVMPIVRQGRPQ